MQHRSADIERRKILAENIKQAVKQEHEAKYNLRVYSRKEIAEAIGVSTKQLGRYMVGCRTIPYNINLIFLKGE